MPDIQSFNNRQPKCPSSLEHHEMNIYFYLLDPDGKANPIVA